MPGPPRDPEDWDDVMGRVADTLDELSVVDGPERDALFGSLRQVLGALGDLPIDSIQVRTVRMDDLGPGHPILTSMDETPVRPTVTLVEGGRDDDSPASNAPRPELRVQSGGDSGWPMEADANLSSGEAQVALDLNPPGVRVARMSGPRLRASAGDAWSMIRLDPDQGREAWQTVFAGREVRPYRLQCSSGELRVFVDGEPITELASGQSVDVEGKLVRVSAEMVVRGRYLRLPG